MAMEVMRCCLEREESGKRDTEARDDNADGLVGEMGDDKKKAAFVILSKATGCGYDRIRKTIKLVSNLKLSSKYIMDKEQPPMHFLFSFFNLY
eukprot:5708865-Ditylum_brightwellii.AAC.1